MCLSKTTLLTPKLVQKMWPNSDLYMMAKKCCVVVKKFQFLDQFNVYATYFSEQKVQFVEVRKK